MVDNPRYHCPIPGCSSTRVAKDFLKHFLNHHSKDELIKRVGEGNLKSGTRGSLVPIDILIDGNKKEKEVRCCFSCKKLFFREWLYMEHVSKCPKKPEHKKICAELLYIEKDSPETIIQNILEEFPDVEPWLTLNYPSWSKK
jgi:hypothetical protein